MAASILRPAVDYFRMSSDRQETSIADQRTAVEAYAAKHGYKIIREYIDEGISGDATDKRLEFQRMMRDATDKGDFEVVLCWDQDRFGRFDPLEAGYWIKPLRDAGIRLETVAQGRIDWEDFAGRIVYAVQQEGKHAFLKDLSRNTLRGKLRAAKQGLWPGGPPPFGYGLEKHKLVLGDPARVAFVAWLFRRYAEPGVSIRTLVGEANEQAVRPTRGGFWRVNVLRKILRCPLYYGDFVWNRLRNGKYNTIIGGELVKSTGTKRGHVTEKDPADYIIVPKTHEAIVDRATWDAAQAKLVRNRNLTTPRGNVTPFLLTGLLVCGHCGATMHGATDKGGRGGKKPKTLRQYQCAGYSSSGLARCERFRVSEQPVVDCIVRKIREDFLNPDNLRKLEAEIKWQLDGRGKPDPTQAKKVRAQLAKLQHQIDQGAERVLSAPAELVEVLSAKLRGWQEEQRRLKTELDGLDKPKAKGKAGPSVDEVIAPLWELEKRLATANPAMVREVIRQTVSRVECHFERRERAGRMVRTLARGLIHLRVDKQIVRDVPNVSTLCPPAAATMRARLANSWPRTSAKSKS